MEKHKMRVSKLVALIAALLLSCFVFISCKNDSVAVKSITLDQQTLTLYVGETETLTAVTDPEDAEVIWSSSDASIAQVEDGVVTAVAQGKAVITAKAGKKQAQCEVTVLVPSPVLSFAQYDYTILGREDLRVDLNAQNANGKTVQWSVKGESVAIHESQNTIIDNASYVVIRPIKKGKSTVTAKVDDIESSFDVEVKDDYDITIGDIYLENDYILTNSSYELDVLLKVNGEESDDHSAIQWASSDMDVATVENGVVTTKDKSGEVTITAVLENATASITFTVYKAIASAADWNAIKNDLNGYYVLTSNIDFQGAEVHTIAPYQLTGASSQTNYYPQHSNFGGVFDGAGYTIKNLKPISMGGSGGTTVDQYTALFGAVAPSGVIKNVSIIGLEGTRCAAGVAFWNEGLIENVYVEMFITNASGATKNNNQAGIVGKNQGRGRIENSIAVLETKLSVTDAEGLHITAALVGFNNSEATVTNSYGVSNRDIPAIIGGTMQPTAVKYDSIAALLSADFSTFDSDIWIKENGRLPRLKHFDASIAPQLTSTLGSNIDVVIGETDSVVTIPITASGLYIYEVTGEVEVSYDTVGLKLTFKAGQDVQGSLKVVLAADATKQLTFNYRTLSAIEIDGSVDYDMTEGGALTLSKAELGIQGEITKITLQGAEITFTEQDGNIVIPQIMTDSGITTMDRSGVYSIAFATSDKVYTMEIVMATKIIKQSDLGGAPGSPAALAAIIFSVRIPDQADQPYYGYYVLGEDIVLDSETAYSYNVGNYTTALFRGTFDGRGHSITGLKTTVDASMFYYLGDGAVIKNIAFYNVNLAGQKTAIIANIARPGAVVENIYAEAKLTVAPNSNNSHPTGVIIQKNAGAAVRNCISVLDVTGITGLIRMGGICGNTTSILEHNVLITASSDVGIVGTNTNPNPDHIAPNAKFSSVEAFFADEEAEHLDWFNQDIWDFDFETKTISLKK